MTSLLIILMIMTSMSDAKDLRKEFMYALEVFSPADGILQVGSPQVLQARYKVFKTFSNMVDANNKDDSTAYQSEINRFSIETDEERKVNLGLNASLEEIDYLEKRSIQEFDPLELALLEIKGSSSDYSSKLPPIKQQGSCGSCWAFGATAPLEYQINKLSSSVKSLAEQEYLDCVYEGQRNGCNGGWPPKCYEFTNKVGSHMALASDYKYVQKDNTCNYKKYKNAIKGFTVGARAIYIKGDAAMTIAVADKKKGVMSCAMTVTKSFFAYKKGVYSSDSCGGGANHAVAVVGYGVDQGGFAYFRIRNSWGSGWGDKGHANMLRGTSGRNINMCRISDYTHYPNVEGGAEEDEKKDEEEDEDEEDDEEETCIWRTQKKAKCRGYLSSIKMSKSAAQKKCETTGDCACVVCKSRRGRVYCGMRKTEEARKSRIYTSYICG